MRASTTFRAAAEASSSASSLASRLTPRRWRKVDIDRTDVHLQPRGVVMRGVPLTALPTDVCRALRQAQLVDEDWGVENITPTPPSLPRSRTLTTSYHLALPTGTAALNVTSVLSRTPLFPNQGLTAAHARSVLIQATGQEWADDLVDRLRGAQVGEAKDTHRREHGRALRRPPPSSKERERDEDEEEEENDGEDEVERDNKRENGSSPSLGQGQDSFLDRVMQLRERHDAAGMKWMKAERKGIEGRRVVIKGLPALAPHRAVRDLVRKSGVELAGSDAEEGEDGAIRRLLMSAGSRCAVFGITCATVADACKLARATNMTWNETRYGAPSLVRAEVVW